jgi:hypothetical protein
MVAKANDRLEALSVSSTAGADWQLSLQSRPTQRPYAASTRNPTLTARATWSTVANLGLPSGLRAR